MKSERLFALVAFIVGLILSVKLHTESEPCAGGDENAMRTELHAPQPQTTREFWGPETNGLKAGLSVAYYSQDAFRYFSGGSDIIPIRCFPLLSYIGTNGGNIHDEILEVDLPIKPCYQLELRDEGGRVVQKTRAAVALGKTVPHYYKLSPNLITGSIIDTGHRPNRYFLCNGLDSQLILPFVLPEYFNITNAGKFTLSFKMCAFIPASNTSEREDLIWLPPVSCKIDIKNDPSKSQDY